MTAINIPIWPGSCSFDPSSNPTPFGLFDDDPVFQNDAPRAAKFAAERLGYPITNIEMQDIQFFTCLEQSILEYSNQINQFNIRENALTLQGIPTGSNLTSVAINPTLTRILSIAKNYGTEAGSGGTVPYKRGYINVKNKQQEYTFNDLIFEDTTDNKGNIEIKRVFHEGTPAITRFFDPFVGTGLGSQNMLESFGYGNMSPAVSFLMMPIYDDLMRIQAIEFNDTVRKSAYSFQITGDRIRIFPIPKEDYKMWIEYINTDERSNSTFTNTGNGTAGDYSNFPYTLHQYRYMNQPSKQWIWKYYLALCKETLGNIRNKYQNIPIPNNSVSLNGGDLVSQGQQEQTELIQQLRETLEETTRSKQLEKSSNEAQYLQDQLSKIPLTIYVG